MLAPERTILELTMSDTRGVTATTSGVTATSTSSGAVSAKHALTENEVDFCRRFSSFGFKNAPDAYRRSFLVFNEDEDDYEKLWCEKRFDGRPGKHVTGKETRSRAALLLRLDYIQNYLEEIKKPAGEHARSVLADQVRFGEDSEARRAAEGILAQEEKYGINDAVIIWANLLRDIGAEVVVPVPDRCPSCGAGIEISTSFESVFPKPA